MEKRASGEAGGKIAGADLFAGVGGLTHGLREAGIDVRLGVDIDPSCEYPYIANNEADFLLKSVEDVTSAEVAAAFEGARFKLLAGCAPCQPFSTYSQGKSRSGDRRWRLLAHFSRLVTETKPHFVTMENVPPLRREKIFRDFVADLERQEFHVFHTVVNCADYGVPQHRSRLVLLASRLAPIGLIKPTTPQENYVTVRDAIGNMPEIDAGAVCGDDPLHQTSRLSPLNLKRIRASRSGGTWRDWEPDLRAACHKKESGKTYPGVYGRMSWDEPSPTITTQFFGFGNGRFGHPDQDRTISLREGAILQGFPETYKLVADGDPIHRKRVGRLIGNAVPVCLGEAVGQSFMRHLEDYVLQGELVA